MLGTCEKNSAKQKGAARMSGQRVQRAGEDGGEEGVQWCVQGWPAGSVGVQALERVYVHWQRGQALVAAWLSSG